MTYEPLVSVIVPVYNQEKYLDAAYACLTEQSYKNLELIFVNDGSTDASPQMLRGYLSRDPRVKLVEKENGGLVSATLAGVEAATGEYVCFLDADDQFGKDHIRFFLDQMEEGCDFVAAGMYNVAGDVRTPVFLKEDRVYSREELRQFANVYLYEEGCPGISNRFFISRCNKFYCTELVRKIAPIFSKYQKVSLGEDSIFTYLILQHSNGGRTVKQCNTYYYDVGNSSSMMKSDAIEAYLTKARNAFRSLLELTKEFGTDESQAYALYGFLVNVLANRVQEGTHQEYSFLHRKLASDRDFQRACALLGLTKLQRKRQLKALVPGPVVQIIKNLKSVVSGR